MIDVLIVGGGPAGLSAGLALARGCKRVLICDGGTPRNARAKQLHNFVTRDGTRPAEFREIARAELRAYPNAETLATKIEAIAGSRGAFRVQSSQGPIEARRILLALGMVDEMLPIEGFEERWGHSIFQCPYCHGWEARGQSWGLMATSPEFLPFAVQLRGWTKELTVFTRGVFPVPDEQEQQLSTAGIRLETRDWKRLSGEGTTLDHVVLSDDEKTPCQQLFVHPPQSQVALVTDLGLTLDDAGFVQVDPMTKETSVPGIYAAGDLTTRMQGALIAAALGTQAAAMINQELTAELVNTGQL